MNLPFYSPMSYLLMIKHLKQNDIVYVPMEMSKDDILARMNMIINKNK